MDSASEQKNTGNVIGGHKANLHNPNTSAESKVRSMQILEEIGADPKSKGHGTHSSAHSGTHSGAHSGSVSVDTEGKNPENVARGYKAALSNPNVSEEAKERAEQKLEQMGAQ
ncbi:hypothetical protein Q9L58_001864 [Maublancomyces gigas]|uniref:Conidiation-specific protein 6 n=1 Tax=Discina gigas TaxID=1032678 RepID=A0ABR3GTC0_9PEZI